MELINSDISEKLFEQQKRTKYLEVQLDIEKYRQANQPPSKYVEVNQMLRKQLLKLRQEQRRYRDQDFELSPDK